MGDNTQSCCVPYHYMQADQQRSPSSMSAKKAKLEAQASLSKKVCILSHICEAVRVVCVLVSIICLSQFAPLVVALTHAWKYFLWSTA